MNGLAIERMDSILVLTLDRPDHMNGITNRMIREARDALELAAADPSIRVLVLTGEGKAFCPGADLKHFSSGGADERLTSREFKVATLLHELPAVTVAAINGACAGAGLGWALACDLRVIAAGARMNTAFLDVAVVVILRRGAVGGRQLAPGGTRCDGRLGWQGGAGHGTGDEGIRPLSSACGVHPAAHPKSAGRSAASCCMCDAIAPGVVNQMSPRSRARARCASALRRWRSR